MIGTFLLLAFFLVATASGEIAMTYGMKATGEPARLRPKEILQFLGRAVRNGWFWVGVPLMAASFYALLILLSWQPISFVIPASALSNVVGTLGAKYILREEVNAARWAGVVLVCIGVALVSLDSIPAR
ncbi:MAG TPA: EamA family transporter [Candidatus Acidoferrum sp.]|nr:EamA family transporter [Candidatus Acidoferrum sp.]